MKRKKTGVVLLSLYITGLLSGCSIAGETETAAKQTISVQETAAVGMMTDANMVAEDNPFVGTDAIEDVSGVLMTAHFTGRAWAQMMEIEESYNSPGIGLVTFEPGARNDWHSHNGTQLLIVTAGSGYYQREGEPAQLLHEGDVVEIPAGTVHWHGATADERFAHLALSSPQDEGGTEWMGTVTEEEYRNLTVSNPDAQTVHPAGNPAGNDIFTGSAYNKMIQASEAFGLPVTGYVTFEPSARNIWHSHSGIQILIATSGIGYCQFEGQSAQRMEPGDMVIVPAGTTHWHGAGTDEEFVHLALSIPLPEGESEAESGWYEAVDDGQYLEAIETAIPVSADSEE